MCERLGVSLLVDVGANDGSWAAAVRRAGYEGAILSFEPNPGAFELLTQRSSSDARWEARPFAIGDREGTADLRLSPDSRWSSLLAAGSDNPSRLGGTKATATVPVRRLDAELPSQTGRIFLKIDVEGFDLHVLRGAEGVAHSVVAGQLEVTVADHFVGQPSILELLTELDSLGLGVTGVENGFITAGGAERYFNVLVERVT